MSSSNNELVTYADLQDGHEDHIVRLQQIFGCSRKAAELAYNGFALYIPHLWVGTKTRDDGSLKGEGLVYGVMRNLGLGFLTKTTEGKKAINIKLVPGRHGNKDHQSCLIKFDRLFTRGEENSGNIAILEHLLKDPVQSGGKTIHNHLQVEYQDLPDRTDTPAKTNLPASGRSTSGDHRLKGRQPQPQLPRQGPHESGFRWLTPPPHQAPTVLPVLSARFPLPQLLVEAVPTRFRHPELHRQPMMRASKRLAPMAE